MKFESQLQIVTAAGVPPFTVNQTALVINLNADLLDGQHGSYYAAASSLGNYLPLTGGTLTGTLTGTIGIFTTVRATELTSLLGSNGPITITPDGTGHVHINSTDIRLGPNNTNATLATRGTGDLILRTNEGSATEGFIRIYDGANGNIEITPNGTGTVVVGKLSGSTASFSGQVTSTVATGTAPLVIASTTAVANLNADLLDGQHGSYYQDAGNLNAGTLLAARLPAFTGGDVTSSAGSAVLTLATVATAGTYRSVTVDAKGRVTAGTNPTTLAGYAISDAMKIGGAPGVDLNTLTTSGVYRINNTEANRPNDWGQLLVMYGGSDTITQIYGHYVDGTLKTRSGNPTNVGGSGSWSPWRTLLADHNYSSYALPLTGGTITGQLSVNGSTASDILRLYTTGSTVWKLGVTDASGSYFNITADFGNFTINKSNGNVTTPGAFVSTVATGTAPLTVTSTTLVSNLNSQYLNGQLGSYYENRDTTAVGFSGGTLTLTRASGNLTTSLDGRYLLLSGGAITGNTTFSGDNHLTFGPNSTWSNSIRIGGNGYTATGTQMASVATTNGNLHLDSAKLAARGVYLNWYGGDAGTYFGNGSGGQVGLIDGSGNASFSGTLSASGAITQNGNQVLHAGNYSSYAQPIGTNLPYSWVNTADIKVFTGAYSYNTGVAKYLLLWQRTSGATGTNGRFVDGMLKVWRGANHAGNAGTVGYIHASSGYSGTSSEVLVYTPFTGQALSFFSVIYNSVEWVAISLPISDYRWELRGHYGIQSDTTTVPIQVHSNDAGVGTITALTTTSYLLHTGTTSAPNLSIGGSAAQLNGQPASYYENRDTTAVGFSAGTLTLTRAAGNLAVSLDGRYLPLAGGTLTGGLSGTTGSFSGALSVSGTVQAGFSRLKVFDYNLNNTPTNGIRIATAIPQTSGVGMYTLIFEGYRYGDSAPEMWAVSFYPYNTGSGVVFINYGGSCHGGKYPSSVQLGWVGGFANIFILSDLVYYRRFTIRAVAGGMGESNSQFEGWVVSDSNPTLAGATGVVTVPFNNEFGNVAVKGSLSSIGAITQNGNQVVHAGNVSTYALPSSGGSLSGALSVSGNITITSGGSQFRASDGTAAAPGYSFNADTDTGIRRPSDNSIAIVTGGVDRLTFGSTGTATFSGQIASSVATGTAPLSITSTTLVSNLNADLLDGQHASYFENRDITAVGFSGGTLTLTRAAGNLTASLDGRYLQLAGGTLTGNVTSTSGMTQWSPTTPGSGVGNIHIGTTSAVASTGGAITFGARDTGSGLNAQAGIYVVSDGSYGTKMFLATTDSYAAGSKVAISIDHSGNVDISRGALRQGGNQVLHAGNVSTYALPIAGGTITSNLAVSGTLTVTGITYANGGLQTTTGQFTGPLLVNNDNGVRASYDNGGSFAWLYGYGVEFGRSNSYVRPNTNRSATLFVGGPTINTNDWLNIDFYSSGRFTINNNAILHAGNYTSYAPNINGGSTIAGITYFSNGESMQVYGIRGRFTNEYLHLYNKVGVGHPGGWGQGEGNTPDKGLSTYGGINVAYGNNATSSFAGQLNANGGLSLGGPLYYSLYTRRQISLAGPSTANFGNWKQFIRLWAASGSGANLFTLKVSVRGSWNWTPVFGTVEAYYSLHLPGDGTINTLRDFRLTHISGPAADNVRLGDAVIENGYISIPVWGANTNALEATVEQWNGSQILGSTTTAVSETLPAFIAPNFRGGLTSDGNAVLHAATTSAPNLSIGGNAATATNASQLGGNAAANFVQGAGSRGRSTGRSNGTANSLTDPSGFYYGATVTGMPTTDWWHWIQSIGNDWSAPDGYGYQLACSYWSDDLRLRRLTSGTWGSWVQLLHSGNYSSYSLPLSGGTMTGNIQLSSGGYVGLNGGSTYGIGTYSGNRNSAVFDTVESTGTDPLELNYYQGGPVKIGSGANGSKSLYAVGIYDNGNQVVHAGNVSSYTIPLLSSVAEASLDTATATGLRSISKTGYSSLLLTLNAGGSTGPFQLDANYTGVLRWRNQTDSTTWTAWKTLIHDGNYTNYPPARWATGRTISITGDVTGTSGTFDGTANLSFGVTIANSAVTYAKIQNVAVASVLGNSSASVAQAPQALSMATLASLLSGQTMNIVGSSTSCSGNAATATNLSTNRTNWAGNGILTAVVGQIAWKNYGNNHTIFDASAGTAPDGSAVNNTNAQVAWTGTYPTLMGWNGANTYGVRVDSARVADSATSATSAASATTATNSTQLNGQAASYYENRDTTSVSISAGTLTLGRGAGNLTTTIGGRVVAWCDFNGNFASSQSPNASFNVSSITKNATGDYTVNFSSSLGTANYVVAGTAQLDTPSPGQSNYNVMVAVPRRSGAKAAGSCRVVCEYPAGVALYDSISVGVAFIAA